MANSPEATKHSGTTRPLRICFVVFNALPAISAPERGAVGGKETRGWLFARSLAAEPNSDVWFALHDSRRPPASEVDGVHLALLHEPLLPVRRSLSSRVRVLQKFPWLQVERWSPALLWQAPLLALARLFKRDMNKLSWLRSIAADVYIGLGVNEDSWLAIQAARERGAHSILLLASDSDLDPQYLDPSNGTNFYGVSTLTCRNVLMQADQIVAQTESQRDLLQRHFGRTCAVVENPIDVTAWDTGLSRPLLPPLDSLPERFVLWVGRAEGVHKRPQLCIDAARATPEIPYVMVLNPRDPQLEAQIRAAAPRNVRIVPFVPFDQMPALLARAALLLNTSLLEGFSNVFLQAALSQTPVVSLQVGRDYFEWLGMGRDAEGDWEKMVAAIRETWGTPPGPEALSQARIRVAERFAASRQAQALREVIDRQVALPRPVQRIDAAPGP